MITLTPLGYLDWRTTTSGSLLVVAQVSGSYIGGWRAKTVYRSIVRYSELITSGTYDPSTEFVYNGQTYYRRINSTVGPNYYVVRLDNIPNNVDTLLLCRGYDISFSFEKHPNDYYSPDELDGVVVLGKEEVRIDQQKEVASIFNFIWRGPTTCSSEYDYNCQDTLNGLPSDTPITISLLPFGYCEQSVHNLAGIGFYCPITASSLNYNQNFYCPTELEYPIDTVFVETYYCESSELT